MSRVTVIAEIGVNHNGDAELARRLIDAAADAGADAVKFQTFDAAALATKAAPKAAYQLESTASDQSQLDMLRALELPLAAYGALKRHAEGRGLEFLSTPFDPGSLAFLVEELGVATVKIGSGDLTDGPLLLAAARSGRRLIVSTGMSTLDEIADALDVIAYGRTHDRSLGGRADFSGCRERPEGKAALEGTVTLLHCTSLYPAPVEHANLHALATLRERFGLPVGYSDHTVGLEVSLAAVALGAVVIEKHLTLDREMAGPDHSASAAPREFEDFVSGIRVVEAALGSAEKKPVAAEMDTRRSARKSLVASRRVAAGQPFTAADVAVKRPGDGLSPIAYWDVLGKPAVREFSDDEVIEL